MNNNVHIETRGGRLSLFVFIDAFGWELVQHYPFLDRRHTNGANGVIL